MATIPLTKRGAEKLKEELHRLKTVERHAVINAISEARAQGDLSENAEYESAKNRQSTIQARFAQIQKRLADLSRIDVTGVPKDRAGLGSEVTVENLESGEEILYTLVIPELADGNKSFVSMASPVGKALMNRRVGDAVTITIPRGTLEYEVRRIVTLSGDVLE